MKKTILYTYSSEYNIEFNMGRSIIQLPYSIFSRRYRLETNYANNLDTAKNSKNNIMYKTKSERGAK
jgi:hypothetical protein